MTRGVLVAGVLALCGTVANADVDLKVMREAQARGVLHRWLVAQNAGAFKDYETLYAPGFRGVRRSGAHIVRLDRKGWLGDRKRMFKKPQRVRASAIQVNDTDTALEITFTQSYRSGSYEDEGPKRMV